MPGYADETASHPRPTFGGRVRSGIFFKYLYAVAAVLLTFAVAFSLNRAMGVRSLSLLFLFPVIAAAARLGIKEALLAALLSTILFNIFFLEPVNVFRPVAAQTWIMLAVLGSLAIYTAAITARLRAEAAASRRRSEAEQSLAAFAATLLRQRDRSSLVHEICAYLRDVFGVHAVVLGEGLHANIAPSHLDPLDLAALDWARSTCEPAGNGTDNIPAANWQFRPLGQAPVQFVLGLARDDGRNPIAPDREAIAAMIEALSALALVRSAHEEK